MEGAITFWRRWEGHVRFGAWCLLYLTAIGLAALLIGYIVTTPALAHGQSLPASFPASHPIHHHRANWFVANWPQIAAALGWLLANLATMLSNYPEAKDANTKTAKAIRFIRLFAALVSVVHFSNTGGKGITFKVVGLPVGESHLNPPDPPSP